MMSMDTQLHKKIGKTPIEEFYRLSNASLLSDVSSRIALPLLSYVQVSAVYPLY